MNNTVDATPVYTYHANTGELCSPPVRPEWRVMIRYRGGEAFDPDGFLPSGLPASQYDWRHTDPPSEGDIMEYAVMG